MKESNLNVMEEKRFLRIKQYMVWILLLAKRLWRQPVYIGLLILIPLLGYAVGIMEHGGKDGAVVAVCVEDGSWSKEITALLQEQEEEESVLQFLFCNGRSEAERCVAAGEADCGFVIATDIEDRVLGGEWRKSITVYETDSSSITGIAKERLAAVIFRLYSEEYYKAYMQQVSGTAADFALEAYEKHMRDESTFRFRYLHSDQTGQIDHDMDVINDGNVNNTDASSNMDINDNVSGAENGNPGDSTNTAVFPTKGVFAVLIFIGGMCGMLEYEKDKKDQKFLRLAPNALTYIVNIWISTVFLSAAVLFCLWLSDGIRACSGNPSLRGLLSAWGMRMWGRQIVNLLIYQCIIVGYCVILRMLMHRTETIAASIPVLALGSLICAPVFIRLGTYLPIFAVLEKLFPVSYYLMF